MKIVRDDLTDPQVLDLLEEHFSGMLENSPKDHCHFLDLDALKGDDVTVWTVWNSGKLAGIGALKQLDGEHGEIKSMRTAKSSLGLGVGYMMLNHIIHQAKARGYKRLSLETGSGEAFVPAIKLYERSGFTACPPFGDYVETEFNTFMTKELT